MILRYPPVLSCCDFKVSREYSDKEAKRKESQDAMGTEPIQFPNEAFPMMPEKCPTWHCQWTGSSELMGNKVP